MWRKAFLRGAAAVACAFALNSAVPVGVAAELPVRFDRAAPEDWTLWRCGPIAFPDSMEPQVPEAVAGSAIEFGPGGGDLTIVVPEQVSSDYDDRALHAMIRLLREKVPRAAVVAAADVTSELRRRHLLLVGTPAGNAFVRAVLGDGMDAFLAGSGPGGYRLGVVASPFQRDRKVILALGADRAGAWPVAGILAYAIHPDQKQLTELRPWPVRLPAGIYWAPFEARCVTSADSSLAPTTREPIPRAPRVPFGVRVWGSPMPTLGSFQRLVRVLRSLGIDTITIQGGGWPDLPDAAERYRTAVDLAWREGIYTILYVGNEMAAHRPAPLTANHRAVVMATKDLPGLLEWHLYNQLSADLDAGERQMVEEQVHWLRSVSSKRVGVEVVWGHDAIQIPAEKISLIQDLKNWGMTVVANDDAPIGGWSRKHDLSVWEPRLRELSRFGLPMEAVLQAHVPFVEPTLPSALQVRQQFWWAVAGGARGFFFETAYLFTHLSNRGLLSWDLRPLPDGRWDEIRRLAQIAQGLEPMLVDGSSMGDAAAAGLELESDARAALRIYHDSAGRLYLLLINKSADTAVHVMVAMRGIRYFARELAPGGSLRAAPSDHLSIELAPGDGACLALTASKP